MQIEIKTTAYGTNPNYIAITDALIAKGYKYLLQLGGKRRDTGEAVTITTSAPESALADVTFTKSAVTIRA